MLSLRGEWELVPGWSRGSAFTPAAVAVVVLVAALGGHFAGVSWWWAAPAGVAGGVAVVAAAARTRPARGGGGGLAYRLVCVACTATWLGVAWAGVPWAVARFPWSGDWLGVWAAGSAALGGLAVASGRKENAAGARRAAYALTAARAERGQAWKQLIEEICHVEVAEVVAVQAWPATKTCAEPGFTVEARLGGGGTWGDVATFALKLASKARLPYGCAVNVSQGNGADLVLLDVSTHDTLADEVPYPEDCERRSVNDDYSVGVRRDGSEKAVNTRENSVFIAGQKKGGKTNYANVFIARGGEAVDGLTCVIDLKGDLIPPWVQPYLEGRAERPAVDWPARTVEQGIRMCEALIRMGDARAAAPEYIRLKREHDSNLLPLSAKIPQFNLYVDEGKGITGVNVRDPGMMKLALLIETIREKYRSQGLNVYFTCLRAIATAAGGTDARVQSAILMLVKSKTEEIRNTFDDTAGLSAADIPNQGNSLIAEDSERPEPIQGFHLKPKGIDRVAVKIGHPDFHPDPDPVALAALGADWDTRWDPENAAWLLDGAGVDNVPMTPTTPPPPAGGGTDPMKGVGEALADMERIADRLRGGQPTGGLPGGPEADVDAVFGEMAARFEGGGVASEPGPQRMLAVLFAAGPRGMGMSAVYAALAAEGLAKTQQTVNNWLRAAVAAGRVVQPEPRGPYIHSDHAG